MTRARRTFAALLSVCCLGPTAIAQPGEQGLVRVEIAGPAAVPRGAAARYELKYVGSRTSMPLQATRWTVHPPEAADIAEGLVTFNTEPGDHDVVITAFYEHKGTDHFTELPVRVIDTAAGPGFALWFDGERAKAVVPRTPRLETAELTLEMWARIEGPQREHTRLARKIGPHATHGYALSLSQGNSRIVEFRQLDARASDRADHSRYAGAWHHYAIVYDRHRASLLIDGQIVDTRPHTLGPMRHSPPVDLIFGNGVEPKYEAFRGTIDEIRIWSRALTAEEIQARLFKPLSGEEPGLKAWYRCDDPLSQRLEDASPNRIHGYLGDSIQPDPADPAVVISDRPRTLEEFLAQRGPAQPQSP